MTAMQLSDKLIIHLETNPCPLCGDELDTGAGFGCRDLECDCGWMISYPLEDWYRIWAQL